MKNFFLSATLLALLPLLFACNKSDVNTDEPQFAAHAGKLVLKDATVKSDTPAPGTIVSIELSESGLYVVGRATAGTDLDYSTGTYTVQGKIYSLQGFGTLEFDNGKAGDVSVKITTPGGGAQTVSATFRKATESNPLYRTWTIEKTRVNIHAWVNASADFPGCNFYDIAKFARDSGHDAPSDLAPDFAVKSLTFTGTNTVFLVYTDNTLDLCEFSLSGNTVSYSWDHDKVKFTFVSSKAQVEYVDGKCLLSVDTKIQNSTTSVSVTFVLTPLN
ncbi:MAG: hypothetical protein J6M23_00100 [Bacteroidales bacterium]|nr:hypothetical protein [Bacteroidales bacterium]MBQ9194980.1 hypothetical protein [Bacteroidales bacterium]